MSRLGPIAAVAAAAAALSACSTVSRIGNMFGGDSGPHETAPQEGRISIMAFEQQLSPDPALQSRHIVVPPAVPTTEWSQPGGTADNSPPNIGGVAALQTAWRTGLGAGSNGHVAIAAPPVIADGTLYFIDADHRVHAVSADNGDRKWTEQLRPQHSRDRFARGGGVAVSGSRLYVTTGYGFIVALDTSNGHEVWRTQAGAPFNSAPTVANGRVYAITNDSELVSYDAETGSVEWNFQAIAEPARILSASSIAVDGETVIAPFASGEIVALLNANGRRLWSDSLSRSGRLTSLSAINDIAGRPVVEGGVVYAASHSGLLAAIDIRSGQRIWAISFASTQTPWIAGDVLYAVNVDGELCAFDKATGHVYWLTQLRRYRDEDDHKGRVSWAGPIMVGSRLVLASSLGEVVAVTPENGQVVAHGNAGQPVFIPPVAANNQIYLVTDDARLVVLR